MTSGGHPSEVTYTRLRLTGPEVALEDTRTRILDAALTVLSRHGLSGLSLDQVAKEAGVARQTVYRYVGSRDGLITATVLREEQVFLERLRAVAGGQPDLRSALEAAIASAMHSAREHPMLDRLLATEPEALLPFLVDGSGPVLSAAKTVVVELLGRYAPHLVGEDLDRTAEAITRLIISYAIAPPPAVSTEDLAATLASLLTDGLAVRHATSPHR